MTTCAQAGCLNTDLKAYRIGMGPRAIIRALCQSCAASLSAIGLAITPVERRVEDIAPVVERRRSFRPAWLSRLTARDNTGRIRSVA
jgi:hypothetical protein